jgi:predicted transcriptional regulator
VRRENLSADELAEQARFLAAIDAGLADADAGRVHPHAFVVRTMKRRYRTRLGR